MYPGARQRAVQRRREQFTLQRSGAMRAMPVKRRLLVIDTGERVPEWCLQIPDTSDWGRLYRQQPMLERELSDVVSGSRWGRVRNYR